MGCFPSFCSQVVVSVSVSFPSPSVSLSMGFGHHEVSCRHGRQPGRQGGGGRDSECCPSREGKDRTMLSAVLTTLGQLPLLSGLGRCFCPRGTRLLILFTNMEDCDSQLSFGGFRGYFLSAFFSLSCLVSFPSLSPPLLVSLSFQPLPISPVDGRAPWD